jgi:hypothetical protein
MSGEPTKPQPGSEASPAQKTASGKAGSLPEAKSSASEDIAAFVAKARAMSPHAAGVRARRHYEPAADMGYGLYPAG